MEKARTITLILFGTLAFLAYLPMLWVSYLYVLHGDWTLGYAAAVGALICVVAGMSFVLTAWKRESNHE